jgi:uncharacterized protein DUF5666
MKATFKGLRRWAWLPIVGLALAAGLSFGGGGIAGTGSVAYGAIDGFGSVFVNGIEYFTNTTDIVIDGVGGQPESALRVGMVVRVDGLLLGTGATGHAATLTYDADVRGALDAAPLATPDGYLFTVDGIPVEVSSRTFLDGMLTAGELAAGDRVEVSGLRDDNEGGIRATRVARAGGTDTVLTGTASNLAAGSFTLGAVTVAFDANTSGDTAALAEGVTVRVKSGASPVAGILAASAVRVLDGTLRAAAGTEASAQGVVSGLTTSAFSLGGQRVVYDANTGYRNGTAADLANGALVEAEGIVDASGAIVASRITLPAPDDATIEASVTSISADGFTVVTAGGVKVVVGAGTQWRDRSSAKVTNFGLAQLSVGDSVAVDGKEIDDGVLLASGVERVDRTADVAIMARARSTEGHTLTLLSMPVRASASASYSDVSGKAISASAFFAKAAGRKVKAEGHCSRGVLIGTDFEIEP